jgi:DNA replication protein DnaC
VKKIQATYSEKGQSEENVIRALFSQKLLILDDLGTYRTENQGFLSNIYNRIFNDYLAVKNKPLLITTNLPLMIEDEEDENGNMKFKPPNIEDRIGARSFSRLCDGLGKIKLGRYVDLFDVSDYRIEKFLT